jgi:hypothetical protein
VYFNVILNYERMNEITIFGITEMKGISEIERDKLRNRLGYCFAVKKAAVCPDFIFVGRDENIKKPLFELNA